MTDGLLILRYLFGFTGPSLIDNAIGAGAQRDTADEIIGYLNCVRNDILDPDADGEEDPLTDGLLLLRYFFGFRDDTLIADAVDTDNCNNCTADEIEDYIEAVLASAP